MRCRVWVATELYPASTVILVGATEDALLREVVSFVGRDEYEGFVNSLKGDEATDVTFDDEPREVLKVWAGEFSPDGAEGGYFIGSDWLVREVEVSA